MLFDAGRRDAVPLRTDVRLMRMLVLKVMKKSLAGKLQFVEDFFSHGETFTSKIKLFLVYEHNRQNSNNRAWAGVGRLAHGLAAYWKQEAENAGIHH